MNPDTLRYARKELLKREMLARYEREKRAGVASEVAEKALEVGRKVVKSVGKARSAVRVGTGGRVLGKTLGVEGKTLEEMHRLKAANPARYEQVLARKKTQEATTRRLLAEKQVQKNTVRSGGRRFGADVEMPAPMSAEARAVEKKTQKKVVKSRKKVIKQVRAETAAAAPATNPAVVHPDVAPFQAPVAPATPAAQELRALKPAAAPVIPHEARVQRVRDVASGNAAPAPTGTVTPAVAPAVAPAAPAYTVLKTGKTPGFVQNVGTAVGNAGNTIMGGERYNKAIKATNRFAKGTLGIKGSTLVGGTALAGGTVLGAKILRGQPQMGTV